MKKVLVALLAAAAIAMLIAALRMSSQPVTPANAAEVATTQATTAVPAAPPPPPPPVVEAPAVAPPAMSAAGDAVVDPDHFARRAEIEAAAARGDLTALPELLKTDLTANGYVAAAAIDAVGKLAALAPEKEKREAVRTLGTWLQQESKRKTNDAQGNVSILVDALQDSKSDAAIAPLVTALDSASQPLHVESRIVEALTTLNATGATGAVERFAGRVRALQPQDEFQKELAAEALAAANDALKKWQP